MSMARTQIYLTEAQRRRVQEIAASHQSTMAEVIREAIEFYLAQQDTKDAPLIALAGLGESGDSQSSEEHDRVIYDAAHLR